MKKNFSLKWCFLIVLHSAAIHNAFAQVCENSGIGTITPTSKLQIKGCGSSSATSAFSVLNSANTQMFFIRDDARIGIGTTTPSSMFHLNYGNYAAISLGDDANGHIITHESNDNSFNIWTAPYASATLRLRLDAMGKLGIGTAPSVRLHAKGSLTSGGEVGIFENNNSQAIVAVNAGTSSYNMLTLAGDNGIFWNQNSAVNPTVGFLIAPHSNAYNIGLRIAGNGKVAIGGNSPTVNPTPRFEVLEPDQLGLTAADNLLLTTIGGHMGGALPSAGNHFKNNLWLKRKSTTLTGDWTTSVLHDAISVDVSFGTPGTSTRTWWERDPDAVIQSWGDNNLTFMTLKGTNLGIGSTLPEDLLQVGAGAYKSVIGAAAGANLGYGTTYLGFNASRPGGTSWSTATDGSNNGGVVMYGTIFGDLRFSTVPSTGATAQSGISDVTIAGNTKMVITNTGNVGIGTVIPNVNSKLAVKDGHMQAQQTTLITSITVNNGGTGSLSNATDVAGKISITPTVTSTTATFTFSKAYTNAIVILTPTNAAAAAEMSSAKIYVTAAGSTCTINFGAAPTTAVKTFNYMVIETQ